MIANFFMACAGWLLTIGAAAVALYLMVRGGRVPPGKYVVLTRVPGSGHSWQVSAGFISKEMARAYVLDARARGLLAFVMSEEEEDKCAE